MKGVSDRRATNEKHKGARKAEGRMTDVQKINLMTRFKKKF